MQSGAPYFCGKTGFTCVTVRERCATSYTGEVQALFRARNRWLWHGFCVLCRGADEAVRVTAVARVGYPDRRLLDALGGAVRAVVVAQRRELLRHRDRLVTAFF